MADLTTHRPRGSAAHPAAVEGRPVPTHHLHALGLVAPHQVEENTLPGLVLPEGKVEFLPALHLSMIHGEDHILLLEARALAGAAGNQARDHHAIFSRGRG